MDFVAKLLVLAVISIFSDGLGAQARTSQLCPLNWQRFDTLHTRIGAPVAISRPATPIFVDGKLMVVGAEITFGLAIVPDPIPAATSLELDPSTALGVTLGEHGLASLVQRPAFLIGKKIEPLIFPFGRRGFHLIWGQELSEDGSQAKEIYYSKFDGSKWSTPELALLGDHIGWENGVSAVTFVGDEPVIAAPAYEKNWRGILSARRTKAGWQTSKLSVRSPFQPAGISLLVRGSQVGLVYRDLVDAKLESGANIYLRRMSKETEKWSEETVIRHVAKGALNWPQTIRTNDGVTHIFWMHWASVGDIEHIEHLASNDLQTWTFDSTLIVGHALGYAVAPNGHASVTVLIQASPGSPLNSMEWSSGRFTPVQVHSAIVPIGPAPIFVSQDGDRFFFLWLAMTQFEFKKNMVTFPVSVTSEGFGRC